MPDDPRTLVDLSRARRYRASHVVALVVLAGLLLALVEGPSIRRAGERMEPGVVRTAVLAVGKPAGAAADRLPLDEAGDDATAWLAADAELGQEGGFGDTAAAGAADGAVPPVTPDAFDPATFGERPARRKLGTLLVTGDSLAMPLDAELARRLAARGVRTVRDPHVGTGVSKADVVDWGRLSSTQVRRERPDAVVMFIGANEGFPLPGPGGDVECCSVEWASVFAFRVRRMMDAYRMGGRGRVYWLTLPAPRDDELGEIARVVNASIAVAAAPYRAQVRVLDMGRIFTPGGRYRDAMDVGGRETIVRESDGIHLNAAGAEIAADAVIAALARDFAL
jgi:lysophospholipase L1-like esterase